MTITPASPATPAVPNKASLTLGPLAFATTSGAFELVALSTDRGTTWGYADTVDVVLRSFLQYGQLVETENWTTRELVLVVKARGENSDRTAELEALLLAQLHRKNTLTYKPKTATVPTVFPVLTSTLVPTDSSFRETSRAEVIYQIKFTCAPFVRAAELQVIQALDNGSVTELIEEVTTGSLGWTGKISQAGAGTVSTSVGSAGVAVGTTTPLPIDSAFYLRMTLEKEYAPIDTSVTKYIGVDYRVSPYVPSAGTPDTIALYDAAHGGAEIAPFATIPSPDEPGDKRAFFTLPAGTDSVTSLRVIYELGQRDSSFVGRGIQPSLRVSRLIRTNVSPSLSARQTVRSLNIAGVMPTVGNMAIATPSTAALKDVLVNTYASEGTEGYVPACRTYIQVAGTNHADAVSGSRNNIGTGQLAAEYRIPNDKLPDGTYQVAVRIDMSAKSTAGMLVGLIAGAYMGGAAVQPDEAIGLYDVSTQYIVSVGGQQFLVLDTVELPRVKMAKTANAYTKLLVGAQAGTGAAYLDELYLLNLDVGQYHLVSVGDFTHMWIDSPDISNDGQPQIWLGYAADRSDVVSAYPFTRAHDIHEFDPIKGVTVFLAATGPTTPALVEFSYYPQYWSRVPPLVSP